MHIKNLDQMFGYLKSQEKKRLVVAYGQDLNTLKAVSKAVEMGIIEATIIGDQDVIKRVCEENALNPDSFEVIDEKDENRSGQRSVELIHDGKADFIMKGLIGTDKYMRAILNKEKGLLPPKGVLSHITVFECEHYHKLIIASDVAVIPEPELKQKIAIANYLTATAKKMGIEVPKIAVISATEKINPKMVSCVDAAILSKMADRGQIKNCVIDGPFALDVAIDKESADIKKVNSIVAGDADCLLFPNIETGNVFYKTMTKLAKAELGAYVVGAKVPAILPSRGDGEKSKLYSIAFAALMA